MIINSPDAFKEDVGVLMTNIIKDLSKDIAKLLESHVYAGIYAMPSSEAYSRTYDFLNAITASEVTMIGNHFEATIYIDWKELPYKPPETQGKMPSRSLDMAGEFQTLNGKPIGYWLIEWIEEGGSLGIIRGKPKAVHMFQKTNENLKESFNQRVIHLFGSYGVKL